MIVVVMGKRLEQQNTVEALNGDRDALKRKADSLSSPETEEMRRPRVLMKNGNINYNKMCSETA